MCSPVIADLAQTRSPPEFIHLLLSQSRWCDCTQHNAENQAHKMEARGAGKHGRMIACSPDDASAHNRCSLDVVRLRRVFAQFAVMRSAERSRCSCTLTPRTSLSAPIRANTRRMMFTIPVCRATPNLPQDKGPATINVSSYPPELQKSYKVFTEKCSKCHTIARPIKPLRCERAQLPPPRLMA